MSYKTKFLALLKAKGVAEDDPEIAAFVDEFDGDYKKIVGELTVSRDSEGKALGANDQWKQWYQTKGFKVDDLELENLTYKQKLKALSDAGFEVTPEDRKQAKELDNTGQYMTKTELDAMKNEIFNTFDGVTTELFEANNDHFKRFGEGINIKEIRKLCAEERISPAQAYAKWAAPAMATKQKEDMEKEIARRVTEGVAAETSRQGIQPNRKRESTAATPFSDHIKGERPKEKVSNKELFDSFVDDMYSVEPKSAN